MKAEAVNPHKAAAMAAKAASAAAAPGPATFGSSAADALVVVRLRACSALPARGCWRP